MAKRQSVEEHASDEEGKVPVQVRLDTELHEKLKRVAEEANISMNQLVNGMCWGLIDKAVQGEAKQVSSGLVTVEKRRKCLFFGEPGVSHSPRERAEIEAEGYGAPLDDRNGDVWFKLDFTNRGVVR